MKLSIIIPCYNVEKYIVKCLQSISSQFADLDAYEVICVDDGSTDGTCELIKSWFDSHAKVNLVLLSQKNQGQSVARNLGLEYVRGEYVWFIDADDYIAENVAERILSKAHANQLDILWFDHDLVDEYGQVVAKPVEDVKSNISEEIHNGVFYLKNGFHFSCMPWMFVFSMKFLKAAKLNFEPGLYLEDILFTAVAIDKAKRMSYIDINAYRYLIRFEGSTMRDLSKANKRLKDALIISGKLKAYVKEANCKSYFKKFSSSIATYKLKEAAKCDLSVQREVKEIVKKVHLMPLYLTGTANVKLMAFLYNVNHDLFNFLFKRV